MASWRVRVEGSSRSLAMLSRLTPSPVKIVADDGEMYLESQQFEEAHDSGDVLLMASELLEVVNLLAGLHMGNWHPVTCDAIVETRSDGSRHVFKHLAASISVSASMTAIPTVVRSDGSVEEGLPQYGLEVEVVAANAPLREALQLFRNPTWGNLYKAYELIANALGGPTEMQRRGWATRKQLQQFKHTAQSPSSIGSEARHAVEPTAPPSTPMSHSEAKGLVRSMIEDWLRALLEGAA